MDIVLSCFTKFECMLQKFKNYKRDYVKKNSRCKYITNCTIYRIAPCNIYTYISEFFLSSVSISLNKINEELNLKIMSHP